MKQGQVSIFILIGLLIVLFVGFFGLYTELPSSLQADTQVSSLQLYIQTCVEDISTRGVVFVSLQGGYYQPANFSFSLGLYDTPYYYSENEKNIPPLETIESEIANYIQDALPLCISNFTPFLEQGYTILEGTISSFVMLQENTASITVEYPITATYGNTMISLNTFSTEVTTFLYSAHSIAERILEAHEDATYIPLSIMQGIAEQEQYNIDMGHFNGTVVYSINKQDSSGELFVYNFAVLYNWSDES